MTKKDYVLIAEVFIEGWKKILIPSSMDTIAAGFMFGELIDIMVRKLKGENSRFDATVFKCYIDNRIRSLIR